MEEKIFEFIKTKKSNLLKIVEFKLKDVEDEYGRVNEHYVVKCSLQVPDPSIPVNNMLGEIEKTCLVNISEFNTWLKNKDSIIWV
jgi:hypothetical protein